MTSSTTFSPIERRDDFIPAIVGGDLGAYAVGREFYEAFGVRSYCIAPAPISAISRSAIFDVVPLRKMDAEHIRETICDLARTAGGKRLFVTSNMDMHVENIARIRDSLPQGVVVLAAPLDAIHAVDTKESFARLAAEHGVRLPKTVSVSLAGDAPVEPWPDAFPVIVKASSSVEYVPARRKGFDKVYLLQSQSEVDDLFRRLREVGFSGTMLMQQPVFGDDTFKRSLTVYIDRRGELVLDTGAQVLLEDHKPDMIGNPVTMVTRDLSAFSRGTVELLRSVGWHGPANFDLKVDERTGELFVFECNPRLGRNSYYVSASAVNPMWLGVKDLLDEEDLPLFTHRETALYSVVPLRLALRYLSGDLASEARSLIRAGRAVNPTKAPFEHDLRRNLTEAAIGLNYYRKFAKYYPRINATGI